MKKGTSLMRETQERIRAAYREWGVSDDLPERTTPEKFAHMLAIIEPKIAAGAYRIFSSSFNPNDPELHAFPRPINWHWSSCERALRFWGATVVMTRLPHFWQLESPAHAACRNVGAPIFTNEIENEPVGGAAILSAGVDAIISDAKSSFAFTSHLSQKNIPIPSTWILIHDIRSSQWEIPAPLQGEGRHAISEIHLFPGVPLLEQCPTLVASHPSGFHASGDYRVELDGNHTLITSIGGDPFPLYRYEAALALKETGVCECGRATLERV